MSKTNYVSHPGEYIKDAINELGMTQNEFAIRIGTTGKTISKIISGEASITFDIASKLSDFFGTSVNVWLNLQTAYNEYLRNIELVKQMEEELKILSYFDKQYLSSILKIDLNKENKKEVINKVKKLFMVNSLSCLKSNDLFAFCRTSVLKDIDEKQLILRNAWISLAMYVSKEIECKPYSEQKLLENLPKIKSLMSKTPEEFTPLLKEYLSEAGIKLMFLPYLKGSNVSAVTKWISSDNTIMIAINDHGKDADKIWFNIYHEIGHAFRNKKRHLTISLEKDKINDEDEIFANNFANNQLINKDEYEKFINENDFSLSKLNNFAESQSIPIFMLIGRLQKEGYLGWHMFNEYKPKYQLYFEI
ncbi:MAG: HigA family addiction module antidote protein [Bacilli bacterium]|nr:HigA family addiction module antidote protein [Bacilli bacterium]